MTNNLDYKAIGARIKKARIKAGLSQEALANQCGVTVQHISNIENHNTPFSLPLLISIANTLNTTADHLLLDVIENNHPIIMEEVSEFFKECSKTEIYHYLDILEKIKEFYKSNHK